MSERQSERRRRFDELFGSYGSDLVAYCGWRADSASDAQDAVAEVFLTAWRRLDDVPEGAAARVWLYATARRVIANQRRSSQGERPPGCDDGVLGRVAGDRNRVECLDLICTNK